jgi:hypothetical protein
MQLVGDDFRTSRTGTGAFVELMVHTPSTSRGERVAADAGETKTVGQQDRELDAARVAIVSLLAVTTDEALRSVETALKALAPMYDAAQAALEEMQIARRHRRPTDGQDQDTSEAIEAYLARVDKAR